jgi:S1-C subfamily serine protease
LTGNWKQGDLSWRASSWFGLRHGLDIQPLPGGERLKRGLAADELAFVVRNLFGRGGPLLRKAGLQPGDVIVGMDGKTKNLTESEFLARLRLDHAPGEKVHLTILRGNKRLELAVPMW